MKVRRGVVACAVVAAGVVAGAGVPGVATAAGGAAPSLDLAAATVSYDFDLDGAAPGPGETPATAGGWLLLETGSTDAVNLDRNRDGFADGQQQSLVAGARCALGTSGSLLTFAGSGTSTKYKTYSASYAADALGVAERTSGTSCYQVDAVNGESLVLRLDHAGDLGDSVASSAFLDMELKQGARVLAVASLGDTAVGWYDLQSGGNVGQPLPNLVGLVPTSLRPAPTDENDDGYPDDVDAFECQSNADSGPDAKVGDNCRWPISRPSWLGNDDGVFFDSLSLYAVSGSFSLKGGSDGRVPTESGPEAGSGFPSTAAFFELAGGMLDCGATTPKKLRIADDEPEIRVRRLDNADGSTCTPVPYALNNGSDDESPFAQFLKPMADQPAAQFVLEIDWRVPVDPTTTQLPETSIDYETGGGEVQLAWCPNPIVRDLAVTDGDVIVGTYGYLDGIADLGAADDQDQGHEGAWPGTQFACLGVQQAVVIDDAEDDWVRVSEQIYLLGDAFYRK